MLLFAWGKYLGKKHDVRMFIPCYNNLNTGGEFLNRVDEVQNIPISMR